MQSGCRNPAVGAIEPKRPCRRRVIAQAIGRDVSRTAALRAVLAKPGILLGPACYDGISAKLTEESGFDFAFMSGFSVAAARLAKPDTGLLSYAEMLDQGRNMHEATSSIPIIGDGDTGYGNAMNVKRTMQGYAAAGFAGILLEDQVWPKSCGHVRGKRVVARDEAVARIRAACDARDEGTDIVVVARTDARQAESFQEAMYRAAAFADAGADAVFIDALESPAEMRTLCAQLQGVHKMANMLEGGGKTPILSPRELEAMGFKLCAYPLTLLRVSVAAMRGALSGLKEGRLPEAPSMPSFQELQAAVGFPEYFAEEARYAVLAGDSGGGGGGADVRRPASTAAAAPAAAAAAAPVAIEPDLVVEPSGSGGGGSDDSTRSGEAHGRPSPAPPPADGATIDLYTSGSRDDEYGQRGRGSGSRRAQWLRIRLSDARSGTVKLDTRFPAGFLSSVAGFIPQVAGVDLEGLMKQGKGEGERSDPLQPVLDFEADADRIQVFLEFE